VISVVEIGYVRRSEVESSAAFIYFDEIAIVY